MAAVAKAAVDVLTQKAGANIFEPLGPWWDARTSWKRKYKNDNPAQGPRFWGSTGALVAFTDFWHAADAVYLSAYLAGGLLLGAGLAGRPWWWLLVAGALVKLGFGGVFELCYARAAGDQQLAGDPCRAERAGDGASEFGHPEQKVASKKRCVKTARKTCVSGPFAWGRFPSKIRPYFGEIVGIEIVGIRIKTFLGDLLVYGAYVLNE